MTVDQAIRRLIFHGRSADEGGFLTMLRPYSGVRMEILLDVENALRAAVPALQEPKLDRELVAACWNIVHLGRMWALEPEGMLRRNNLITDADLAQLDAFLAAFSYAVLTILDGSPDEGLGKLAGYRTRE